MMVFSYTPLSGLLVPNTMLLEVGLALLLKILGLTSAADVVTAGSTKSFLYASVQQVACASFALLDHVTAVLQTLADMLQRRTHLRGLPSEKLQQQLRAASHDSSSCNPVSGLCC